MSTKFEFLGVTEAAAKIGMTTSRLRQLLRKKAIKGKKLGKHTWMIPSDELEKLENPVEKRGRPRIGKNPSSPVDKIS